MKIKHTVREMLQKEVVRYFYCANGAYHEYYCCETCWNRHPISQKAGKPYFNKKVREEINKEVHRLAVKRAMNAGFTKKQAEYIERQTFAKFQQIVLNQND